jgi:tRNA(Ile)-lysidine synthase
MRAARPECPWRALGAMAALSPAALWPEGEGLAIARPLLGVRRAALRRWLRRRGHRWIDDPSNANLAFERVRARAALAALEGAGLDPMRLVAAAARVRRAAGAIDRAAGAWLARSAKIEGAVAWLPREIRPGAARARAVWALMAAVGGGAGPPPRPLARLMDRLARPGFRGATLAGCRLSLRGSALELSRDPGALLGRNGAPGLAPLLLRAGGSAVWDGRARIASPAGATVTADHAVAGAPRIAPEGAAAVEWLIHARIRHALGAAAYCSGM